MPCGRFARCGVVPGFVLLRGAVVAKLFSTVVAIAIPALFAAVLSFGITRGCGQPQAPPVVPAVVPDSPTAPVPVDRESAELLRLHNAARAESKLPPLTIDDACQRAAQKHAAWMAARQRMSHIGDGDSSFWERLKDEGYCGRSGGENIAVGYSSPQDVFSGWMNSPGHRRNILGSHWKHVGFGSAESSNGRRYWCAVFAVPIDAYEAAPWIVEVRDGDNEGYRDVLPADCITLWLPNGLDADAGAVE